MADKAQSQFEPHELWFAISCSCMSRYERNQYVVEILQRFHMFCQGGRNRGFKYVYNPGVRSMEWRMIDDVFPNARYVFIERDPRQTYDSYVDIDRETVRGVVPYDIYSYFWTRFYTSVYRFMDKNSERCAYVKYQDLCDNTPLALGRVWSLLGHEDPPSPHLFRFVRENRRSLHALSN